MSSRDSQPVEKTANMHRSQVRCRVFSVACGDAAPFFQLKKDVLNQMPHFIEMRIICPLILPVLSGWYDCHDVSFLQKINNALGVVTFVSDQEFWFKRTYKRLSLRTICSGTRCNKCSDRITMRIHGHVDFRVEPPFVRPISWLPPRAPVAC